MKIGLVPISAKPYHAGHHYLIETAAAKNDKVIVFASTSDRKRKGEFPVCGKTMHGIWQDEILKIMPENVDVVSQSRSERNSSSWYPQHQNTQ